MELRKDYILDRWVIIAEKRGKRPDQLKEKVAPAQETQPGCFFCPGNESTTPPEIGRIEKNGKWTMRWFPNKFSFVEKEGDKTIKTVDRFFTYATPPGEHELIIETADHNREITDLTTPELLDLFKIYAQRIKELSTRYEYVDVIKNHGRQGGASIVHSHSQVIAIDLIPPYVQRKIEKSHIEGKCAFCDIIGIEKKSSRRVFENESFVSFCPYASRFNYEIWLFPKDHLRNITEFNEKQYCDLADMMKKILEKLANLNADFNYVLYYAPQDKDLHFHIEVLPRLAIWAGFEYAAGIIINQVPPENAAKFYRGEQ